MTNEKSPELMAEIEARAHADLYGSGRYGYDGYLAGFQKCESTVAQPLRERVKLLESFYGLGKHIEGPYCPDEAKIEIHALTAENAKLKAEHELAMVACGVANDQISEARKALELLKEIKADPGITDLLSNRQMKILIAASHALAAMAEGKAE